jgi:hypothetical protein
MSTTETVLVTTKACGICGQESTLFLPNADFQDWLAGKSVQSAFPYLDPAERELILTGTHNTCWPRMAPDAA